MYGHFEEELPLESCKHSLELPIGAVQANPSSCRINQSKKI